MYPPPLNLSLSKDHPEPFDKLRRTLSQDHPDLLPKGEESLRYPAYPLHNQSLLFNCIHTALQARLADGNKQAFSF